MKTCILSFDHLSNLFLRRLYYIDAWKLQFIDAYSWKRLQCFKRNTYTVFLKFEFYLIKTYSQKLILDWNVSWIYKHKDKQHLVSHNNLFFQGKIYPSIFWKIEPNSHPLWNVGKIQLWLIKTT